MIRKARNIVAYKHNTEYVFGNLTTYNVDEWKETDKTDIPGKKLTFKLDLFNNETTYFRMNNLVINVILPYIDTHRKEISKYINLDGKKSFFIVSFCIYLIVVFLLYFIFLIPMISYLNTSIYKTKNLLQLIPTKILTSQNHIKSILEIS